jgi:hypothetical protein
MSSCPAPRMRGLDHGRGGGGHGRYPAQPRRPRDGPAALNGARRRTRLRPDGRRRTPRSARSGRGPRRSAAGRERAAGNGAQKQLAGLAAQPVRRLQLRRELGVVEREAAVVVQQLDPVGGGSGAVGRSCLLEVYPNRRGSVPGSSVGSRWVRGTGIMGRSWTGRVGPLARAVAGVIPRMSAVARRTATSRPPGGPAGRRSGRPRSAPTDRRRPCRRGAGRCPRPRDHR